MAYTPAASNASSVDVWINPPATSLAPGGTEPSPNFPNRTSASNPALVNSIVLRSGAGTRAMIFDELRVGNSWSDVTNNSVLLPVKLSDLKLSTTNNISTLYWLSLTEDNFSKYVVMFSGNGVDFNEVGTVLARGNNSKYSFSYSHKGEGFFKLKMIDKDGKFVYSDVLHAKAKQPVIKMSPNPFTDRLYVTGMPEGTNTLELFSVSGSRLKTQIVKDNMATFLLPILPSGKYVLKVSNNGKKVYSSVVVK